MGGEPAGGLPRVAEGATIRRPDLLVSRPPAGRGQAPTLSATSPPWPTCADRLDPPASWLLSLSPSGRTRPRCSAPRPGLRPSSSDVKCPSCEDLSVASLTRRPHRRSCCEITRLLVAAGRATPRSRRASRRRTGCIILRPATPPTDLAWVVRHRGLRAVAQGRWAASPRRRAASLEDEALVAVMLGERSSGDGTPER